MSRAFTANSDVIRLPIDQPITLLEKASTLEANIASPRSWDVLFIAHPEFIGRLWLEVSLKGGQDREDV